MTEIEFKMIAVKITSVKNASLARNIVTKRDFAWLGSETNNGAYYYLFRHDNKHEVYDVHGDMNTMLDRLAPVYIFDCDGNLQYQRNMIVTKRRILIGGGI